jgi:hypothetical protein
VIVRKMDSMGCFGMARLTHHMVENSFSAVGQAAFAVADVLQVRSVPFVFRDTLTMPCQRASPK